jgi:ATP-binding cassette subfamily B protein
VADLRSAVYARVIRMDPAFFEVTRIGEVLSRLTADATLVQSIAGVNLSITLRSTISIIGSLVMLTVTSAKLTGIIVVLIPVVIVPLVVLGRRVRKLSRSSQDRIADTSGLADETLNAIQTVQAFTLEQVNTQRFDTAVEASFTAAVQRTRTRSTLTALATMLVFGAITFVLWMGAHDVVRGAMTGGQLSQFLLYAVYVAIAAASLSEMWGEVQRAAGAMERLVELQNAEPTIQAPAHPVALPVPGRGEVRFDHVTFRYPSRPESKALDDFDLTVRPGETVAFVGPSGAGKSTAFQLLLRFYDPVAGRVLIDGVDIAGAEPLAVRRRIGLVPQDTVLFAASARENIRYGRPDATDAEVEGAARAAAADEFLRRLPQGYDTFLGERGTRLSGGQRQRIAIARAILRDPPILLLDEATSALDAESERLVQAALDKLMQGRTTIVIAHRLATVLEADRIIVMDHGRIVAQGTHGELVRSNELYARLAALQFSAAPA